MMIKGGVTLIKTMVSVLKKLFLCRSVENYLYRVISMMTFVAAVSMIIGLPDIEDKWCAVSIPTYLTITFFIISFDDPWGAKEDRTDLLALFWPILALTFIPGMIYLTLSVWWEDRLIKKGDDLEI